MKRRMLLAITGGLLLLGPGYALSGQPAIGVPAPGSTTRSIADLEIKSDRYDYVGCFQDGSGDLSNRALDGAWVNKWDHMELQTPKWCVDYCEPLGFSYAGWAAPWCSCGNNPNKYGPADPGACTTACPGDPSQLCGGNGVLSVYATGLAGGNPPVSTGCDYLDETFNGTSGVSWTANTGVWSIQGERLEARVSVAGSMGSYVTDFLPPDLFSVDVDVQWVAGPDLYAGYGLLPYNAGDVFFEVDGRVVSGVGAIVYPNRGTARLLAWDVPAQAWYESQELTLPPTVTSVGVAYLSDRVVLRLNGANTALSFSGDFSYAPGTISKLWLLAQNEGTDVWFDNVCAGPSAGTPSQTNPYTLTVTPSGTGSGVVNSTPAGINCGTDCSESYPAGTLVSLAATPASGSTFAGWSGGGCSGTAGCTVTMASDQGITAQFDATVVSSLMPMPAGFQIIYYDAVPTPVLSADPLEARPIALGPVANGEDTFNLEIGLKEFASPVDMYLGAYCPAFDPSLIFLFTKENTLVSASDGLVPWRAGAKVEMHETIFTSVPIELLPPGMWNLWLLVAPSGNPSGQYLWWTRMFSPVDLGLAVYDFVDALGEDGAFDATLLGLDRGYAIEQILDAGLTGRLSPDGSIGDILGGPEAPHYPAPGLLLETAAKATTSLRGLPDDGSGFSSIEALRESAGTHPTIEEVRNGMEVKCRELDNPRLRKSIGLIVLGWVGVGYSLDQIIEFIFSDGKVSVVCDKELPWKGEGLATPWAIRDFFKSCRVMQFTKDCEPISPANPKLGWKITTAAKSVKETFSGDGPCVDTATPNPTPEPVSLPITYGGWGIYRTTREHLWLNPPQVVTCDSSVLYRITLKAGGGVEFHVKRNVYVDFDMVCTPIQQPSWTRFSVVNGHSDGSIAFEYWDGDDKFTVWGTYDSQGVAGDGGTEFEHGSMRTSQTFTFNLTKCENTHYCCDKFPSDCEW